MRCTKLLKDNGYDTIEAGNGVEAVKQYQDQKPDGVLMDITMPDMDGIETLKKLIEIDSGARDFVVKPFNAERVLAAVKKIVG